MQQKSRFQTNPNMNCSFVSSVKDGVVEHCKCQQSLQTLGSLEMFLDRLRHSLGLYHLIDGAVCS